MFGMPAAGGNFVNLKSQNDDFPLENNISEGKIGHKCQNFPPAAG